MSTNPFDPNNPNNGVPTPPSYNPPPQYQAPQPGTPSTPPPPYAAPSMPEYGAPGSASYSQPTYGQPGVPAYPAVGQSPYPTGPAVPAGNLATWPIRALGGLIDYVIPSIIFSVLAMPFSNNGQGGLMYSLIGSVLPLAWMIYNSGYMQGTTGQTFGKRVAKTRLISEETGQPIGFGMAVVRQIAHFVDIVICGIGYLFPLWDVKRQTIADKIMKTVVVMDQTR